VKRLIGAFALAMIFKGQERLLIGARCGPPLAVGYAEKEGYIVQTRSLFRLSQIASPTSKMAMSS